MTDFIVRGFAGWKHHNGVAHGTLLVETTHRGEASAAVTIEAWQTRMRRGEVSRVELIDCRPGHDLTNLNVDASTKIPWSWLSIERLRKAT